MKIEQSELGINEVETFHSFLLSLDISEKKIFLDFENVERMDLSIFQLLISYKKYCDLNKIELSYLNLNSLSVKESLSIYNLYDVLGIK